MRPNSLTLAIIALSALSPLGRGDEAGWVSLNSDKDFEAWKAPVGEWLVVGEVGLDLKNPKLLVNKPGTGTMVTAPSRKAHNLVTKQSFGDVEVHLEFLIPKGSNSGVKLAGVYEIQIYDSWGAKQLDGASCGGIYPRAELEPSYRHIDKGTAPRVNACRPPGDWQTLDITFVAPRFDSDGKKTASARFVKVVLNGQVIHDNVEVATKTGHFWREQEKPTGPLLFQGDHGLVAFRDVRVRPYQSEGKKD